MGEVPLCGSNALAHWPLEKKARCPCWFVADRGESTMRLACRGTSLIRKRIPIGL